MASKKKYVAVDNADIVQGPMNFGSGSLNVQTGENTYKDINKVFIKGIRINHGTDVFWVGNDGIVDLQIEGSVEPEPEPEPTESPVYFGCYGSGSTKTPLQIKNLTSSQIKAMDKLDLLPGMAQIESARQVLVFAVDNPDMELCAESQNGLPFLIRKVMYSGSPITKSIGGETYSVWEILEDTSFTEKINIYWS